MYRVKSLSLSSLNQYTGCPRQFLFKLQKQPMEQVNASLLVGSGFHAAAEFKYVRQMANEPPADKQILYRIFMNHLLAVPETEINFGKTGSLATCIETGKGLIDLLAAEDTIHEVVAVEKDIQTKIRDISLVGRIDLIERDEDSNLVVWDIKTSRSRFSGNADSIRRVRTQLSAYAAALGEPVRMKTMVFLKQKTPSVEIIEFEPDDKILPELKETIADVKHGIESEVFFRVRSPFCSTSCPYQKACLI